MTEPRIAQNQEQYERARDVDNRGLGDIDPAAGAASHIKQATRLQDGHGLTA